MSVDLRLEDFLLDFEAPGEHLGIILHHIRALGRLGGQDLVEWSIFQVRPRSV